MNTVLIHSAFGRFPMLEYELDIVQRELDEGNRVIFLYCLGNQIQCGANNPSPGHPFRRRYCWECRGRVSSGIGWLESGNGDLVTVEYECLSPSQENYVSSLIAKLERVDRNDKAAIAAISDVDGIDIFASAWSNLMTTVKRSNPDLHVHWDRMKSYLHTGLRSYYSAVNHVGQWRPDRVRIYNARIPRYRPLLRVAQRSRIETFCHEYPREGFSNYIVSPNTYPHQVSVTSDALYNRWIEGDADSVDVEKVAAEWFDGRMRGAQTAFGYKFNAKQVKGSLPIRWTGSDFNLVFFISSSFELESIEENVSDLPYDQPECIRRIVASFPDIKVYVRVHPNADMAFNMHLITLSSLPTVTILKSSDSVDSYALVKAADLVLTFASTVGVEAAYQKKPVISVGSAADYQRFGCVSVVKNHDDLVRLVDNVRAGDCAGFPTPYERYAGACAFAWAKINSGVQPTYVEKDAYWGGYMIRSAAKSKVKASDWIVVSNKLLDGVLTYQKTVMRRLRRLRRGFLLLILSRPKRKRFRQRPFQVVRNYLSK